MKGRRNQHRKGRELERGAAGGRTRLHALRFCEERFSVNARPGAASQTGRTPVHSLGDLVEMQILVCRSGMGPETAF